MIKSTLKKCAVCKEPFQPKRSTTERACSGKCALLFGKPKKTYFVRTTGNKFNAKKSDYNGLKYDSKGEASFAMELDYRMKAGEIIDIQRQVNIPLVVNGIKICSYVADFIVTDKHGGKTLYEYKGLIMPLFQLKWKLLNALRDEIFPNGMELEMVMHKSYNKKKKK